jgi:uncharacterized protein (TIGR03118 family)
MKTRLSYTLRKALAAIAACALAATTASSALAASSIFFKTDPLVADQTGVAPVTDPLLSNPWGITFIGPIPGVLPDGSPFWISDNNSGFSTLYDGLGAIIDVAIGVQFAVTIPLPTGSVPPLPSAPTGAVSNVTGAFCGDLFIFDTEDGTLSGWQESDNLAAMLRIDNSSSLAVYKGLELATTGAGTNTLYAANFRAGTIDTFQTDTTMGCTYKQVHLTGDFTDRGLARGYAPFNVKLINGKLFVTYAKQDAAKHDPLRGIGFGFVDTFTTDGVFVSRFASRGELNAPWGLSLAPKGFGVVQNQLLVGNFGDGHINVFDPNHGFSFGQLLTRSGFAIRPIVIDGLWSLVNGTGALNAAPNSLYFTAGPDNQMHGLFGTIAPAF